MFSSFSQVSFNSSALFVSFVPSAIFYFLQLLFLQSLNFYRIIYLDFGELSRELGKLLCLINKFDLCFVMVSIFLCCGELEAIVILYLSFVVAKHSFVMANLFVAASKLL